ncbi:MAG TPA: hypothetical protein VM238_04780 [Phycisphaerae bacterium]|nr:hypothetical protein [Phycisphaerae bacterium]
MPDDRMLHRCQGHSAKLAQCDHLTYRVWTQYLLSADDFGVMPDSAALIRGDNFALEQEPEAAVVAALDFLKQVGLVESFIHQGRKYLCSLAWQNYQHVRFPRVSHYPVPPAEVLRKFSRETAELFERHSERKGLDTTSQPLANANGLRLTANAGAEATGDAGAAWEQWRQAWEKSGLTPLPLTPKPRDFPHLIDFATRYPDPDWRALMLEAFFVTDDPRIRKSPPSLGWFVSTWMDETDKRLRDSGRRPKVAA